MPGSNRHLTDREILQAFDGELPEIRLSAVDRHLAECESCTARRAAVTATAAASTADYRSTMPGDPSGGRSRGRLEVGLAAEAEAKRRLPWRAATPAVAVAAAVVLAATASIYQQSAPLADSFDVNHRLALPVVSITPGATWDASVEQLCAGPTRLRPITASMRAEVLNAYGVEDVPPDQYELDYLITPELGGATDTRNLWPQRYESPTWNARVKDELEALLPQLVCSSQLDLKTAQRDMAVDWVAAYQKYFKTDLPLAAHRGPGVDDDENSDGYLFADAGPAPAVQFVSLPVLR